MSDSKCVLVSIKSLPFLVFVIHLCVTVINAEHIDSFQPNTNNDSLIFAHVVSWISTSISNFQKSTSNGKSISIHRFIVMVIVTSIKSILMIRTKMKDCIGPRDLANWQKLEFFSLVYSKSGTTVIVLILMSIFGIFSHSHRWVSSSNIDWVNIFVVDTINCWAKAIHQTKFIFNRLIWIER